MSERSTGVSLDGLLLVLFIGLKLAGVIDWSWWWVLSPLWWPVALVLALAAAAMLLAAPVLLVMAARRNNGWSAPYVRPRLPTQRWR